MSCTICGFADRPPANKCKVQCPNCGYTEDCSDVCLLPPSLPNLSPNASSNEDRGTNGGQGGTSGPRSTAGSDDAINAGGT